MNKETHKILSGLAERVAALEGVKGNPIGSTGSIFFKSGKYYTDKDGVYELVKKPAKKSWPQEGDEIWVLDEDGCIFDSKYGEDYDGTLEYGSAFKTRDDAEKELTRRKVAARYRNGEWKACVGKPLSYYICDIGSMTSIDEAMHLDIIQPSITLGLVCHPDDKETQDFIRKAVESGAYDV